MCHGHWKWKWGDALEMISGVLALWYPNKTGVHNNQLLYGCLSFPRCLSASSLSGPSVTQPVVMSRESMIWSHPSSWSSCLSLSVSYWWENSCMQSHYVQAELKMTDPFVFVWIARFGFFILVIICLIFFSVLHYWLGLFRVSTGNFYFSADVFQLNSQLYKWFISSVYPTSY